MLLATYSGAGHVLPMARLCDRLRDAGHDAVVLSVTGTAGGQVYASVPPPPAGSFEANLDIYAAVLFGPDLAGEVRDVALGLGAEVVVADALVPAALCGAHASGARAITAVNLSYGRIRSELLAGAGWWAAHWASLNATRVALGLRPYASPLESWEMAERMLLLGIPELEDPGTSLPRHLDFIGPCIPLPTASSAAHARPRVVVSMSSSDMDHAGVLQSALTSLGALDVDVLATTAGVVDQAALDIPGNCQVYDWLPLPEAFDGASAVVTHAGYGTVMAAFTAAAPLVCIPLGRDQPFTAARVAALGAGLSATTATVAEAVEHVLGAPTFHAAAARLRDRIASLSAGAATALGAVAS